MPEISKGKRKFRQIIPHSLKENIPIYIGDSETWKHAHNPAFWLFKNFNDTQELFFDSEEKTQLRKWFYFGKKIIYFHNLDFDLATFMTAEEVGIARKILAGNKIIKLKFGQTEFRDSKALLVNSVAQIGKTFKFKKGITPEKFITGNSEIGYDELDIEYCRRDVEIIRLALNEFGNFYEEITGVENPVFPLTAASMAYRVFSSKFWPFEHKTLYIDRQIFDSSLKSYYGGRVQIFCKGGEEFSDINVYDINSLYPSVMINNDYPHPKKCWKAEPKKVKLYRYLEEGKLVWGHFKLKAKDNALLFLPSTNSEERRDYSQKEFDGFLCQPELIFALENGWELVEIKELYAANSLRPFDDFINLFYNLRLECQKNSDPREYFYKIILNSTYGKFGQKDNCNRIENPEDLAKIMAKKDWEEKYNIGYYSKECWYLTEKEASRECQNSWPAFASFVTSYARVKLAKAIKENGEVIYCDTDSIHTKLGAENLEIGNKLGEWKLEYVAKKARYWEPKVYYFEDENGERILVKHKGANMSDGDLTKIQIAKTFTKYRTSLRRDIPYGEFRNVEKRSKRFYNKGDKNE